MKNILEKDLREKPKQEYYSECICGTECRGFVNVKCKELKQETIEELAKDFYPNEYELMERIAFKRGYTECKERMNMKKI